MELYHVLNRGTEKRAIVMDKYDRLRFVTDLMVMNDTRPVLNLGRSLSEVRPHSDVRERLVTIHAWCLMGNHYHMLLSEQTECGMSKFLQKFNTGYTMYFNLRHERSGALFQGKTKRVLIKREAHFNYILPYIHCNPLDLQKTTASWRTQSLVHGRQALVHIQEYRWSSYRNYCGEKEFSEILEGSELFKNRREHVSVLRHFLSLAQDASLATLNLE